MTHRAYTVAEIDRMRAALWMRFGYHGSIIAWSSSGDAEVRNKLNRDPYDRDVEDKLRTYMLAGVDPEELETLAVETQP